jgi:tRNA(fMet)-specific endonuclease VapC
MRYLLDTNTWIHYLKRVGSPVEAARLRLKLPCVQSCGPSCCTGRRNTKNARNVWHASSARLRPSFRSLPFDDAASRRYAEIRDELEIRGEIIGPNDLLIAAIALFRCRPSDHGT